MSGPYGASYAFAFFRSKATNLRPPPLVAAAEHLVELQTDALNGGEQCLEADDHEVAQDDHNNVVRRTSSVKTTIIMLAWTMTNAPTRKKTRSCLDR